MAAKSTFCVTYTASGAGLASFSFPMSGVIVGTAVNVNQTSACLCSTSGVTAPSSGVSGSDRTLICCFGNAGTSLVDAMQFPIDVGQTVYIDVKVAATFMFFVNG